jgi:hypothetical protein
LSRPRSVSTTHASIAPFVRRTPSPAHGRMSHQRAAEPACVRLLRPCPSHPSRRA